jgi:hypothetical protein
MKKSIITIEQKKLVSFLMEIEKFLSTKLPELYEECSAQINLQNLRTALSQEKLDFHVYTICMRQFVLHVRNCTRMRASFAGNSEDETTKIHIGKWPEVKSTISPDAERDELYSFANKLIDEAFVHLSEILLTMVCIEVEKKIIKSLPASKRKRITVLA